MSLQIATVMISGFGHLDFVFKELWKTFIPSKVLIFRWRLFTNFLPSRDVMYRRHVILTEEDVGCLFCKEKHKDLLHLFDFATGYGPICVREIHYLELVYL